MLFPNRHRYEVELRIAHARLSRRALTGLIASGIGIPAVGAPPTVVAGQYAATPASSRSLAIKGMTYDTGTDYTPQWGVLSREVWETARVQREIAVIHEQLHCTDVSIFGTEIGRNTEGAAIALEQGLRVWIQPRLIDAEPDALLDYLAEAANEAERLRGQNPAVTFNLGVELTLFSAGIVEGNSFAERIPNLLGTLDQLPIYNERLNGILSRANTVVREVFGGPVTYGAGAWEGVDWSDFDFVGVDLYRDAYNQATYVDDVRALRRHGKPVVITEFGCCTYEGAQDAGGSGYDIIDWEKSPPELNGEYVRSEQVQADTIGELVDIYQDEGMHGAFVYTFVEPGQTYSPDPRYDLDMPSFGIVKVFPEESGQGYAATGYWEPKAAFHEIAERFAKA
jgi:hypothetical protein